ncbi:hypothetical protein WJX81_005087 [Elliptochloris bilobata]|uniref:AP2/ERF domain-containing protein n=1 Tax=Elliptochloris bilobata TaxID=381761 RepID=A0AAW1RE16_9CHLO
MQLDATAPGALQDGALPASGAPGWGRALGGDAGAAPGGSDGFGPLLIGAVSGGGVPAEALTLAARKSGSAGGRKVKGTTSSQYRGVTRHTTTGRYEAHLWDSSFERVKTGKGGRSRGKQVYLGGWLTEDAAARAYDLAAIAFWRSDAVLNFEWAGYEADMAELAGMTREEVVAMLKRNSTGFSRGQSKYRGVTRHHQHGRWEARIGRVQGNKYLYLGTFNSEEEAARAYDVAAIAHRGRKAVTNFGLRDYPEALLAAAPAEPPPPSAAAVDAHGPAALHAPGPPPTTPDASEPEAPRCRKRNGRSGSG